jgi:hypothetical protein
LAWAEVGLSQVLNVSVKGDSGHSEEYRSNVDVCEKVVSTGKCDVSEVLIPVYSSKSASKQAEADVQPNGEPRIETNTVIWRLNQGYAARLLARAPSLSLHSTQAASAASARQPIDINPARIACVHVASHSFAVTSPTSL